MGTLELSGGISGARTLTVRGTPNATSIQVDTLNIGTAVAAAVPEPSVLVLLGMGFLGLIAGTWQQSRTVF